MYLLSRYIKCLNEAYTRSQLYSADIIKNIANKTIILLFVTKGVLRMRWQRRKGGDIRFIITFLWFPKCINREFRWLELACIKQQVGYDSLESWDDVRWATLEEYNENRHNGRH